MATVKTLIGNVKGPRGEQGIQGIQGPAGPQGDPGPAYTLTDSDKDTITTYVKESMTTEALTFTYEDGSTRTLEVYTK